MAQDSLSKSIAESISVSGSLIAVQKFTSSGTYTPTAGMANCIVQCVGGGGAGGGGTSNPSSCSAGGGAGGFSQSYVTAATIGASQTVTVGAGGTGVSGGTGNNGNDTSVGTIVIAKGGSGAVAIGVSSGSFASIGGAGGVAGTGDLTFTGGPGGSTVTISGGGRFSGNGGNSYFSGGPLGVNTTHAGISAGANTGAGGSGAQSASISNAGGNGGSGIVIIYEYDAPGTSTVLPTTANHIATYTDTAGTLSEDPTTAITNGALYAGTTITAETNIFSNTGFIQALEGDITAGSNGFSGVLTSFAPTLNNGSLTIAAGNAGGSFLTTITREPMGQSTTYSIGDIGAVSGGLVVATSAIRMKSVSGASAAGGSSSQSFTDAFCTSSSNVIGNWNTQTNAAQVLTIVPGNGSFVVTSTVDAGSATFNYIITK